MFCCPRLPRILPGILPRPYLMSVTIDSRCVQRARTLPLTLATLLTLASATSAQTRGDPASAIAPPPPAGAWPRLQTGYLSRLGESIPVSVSAASTVIQADAATPLAALPRVVTRTAPVEAPGVRTPAPISGDGLEITLHWRRTEASFGFAPGYNGLGLIDLNGDGRPEVVATARGAASYWYVATWTGNALRKLHVSPGYRSTQPIYDDGIVDLKVFHRPDGMPCVAVATQSELLIHDLRNYTLLQRLPLPSSPRRIAIGDIDADGDLDGVVLLGGSYYNYPPDNARIVSFDLASGAQLWSYQAADRVYEFTLADLSAEPGLEIVGAGTPGLLLSGATGALLWSQPSGFGVDVATGNFDADPGTEFVAMDAWQSITVFDGNTRQVLGSRTDLGDLEHVSAHDFNDDGRDEILVGDGQWGDVSVYSSSTQQLLHRIPNHEHGVGRMVAGDLDGDGVDEVLFGAGFTSSGTDQLTVARVSGGLRWSADDEAGPHPDLRIADLDRDGDHEVVWATMASDSGYQSGRLHALDAQTFAEQWVTDPFADGNDWLGTGGLDVGQLDNDPQLEIVVATAFIRDAKLEIRDGLTGQWQRTVPLPLDVYGAAALLPRVLDNGTVLIGYNGRLRTIRLADGAALWTSSELPGGDVRTLTLADYDGDRQTEVIATTESDVIIFDVTTKAVEWQLAGTASALDPAQRRLFAVTGNLVQVHDTRTKALLTTYTLDGPVDALYTARSGARTVLFAVREDGVIEGFDTGNGRRRFADRTERPGFAHRASAVPQLPTAEGLSVWAASAFGVHRADFTVLDTSLFEDGFE